MLEKIRSQALKISLHPHLISRPGTEARPELQFVGLTLTNNQYYLGSNAMNNCTFRVKYNTVPCSHKFKNARVYSLVQLCILASEQRSPCKLCTRSHIHLCVVLAGWDY